VARPIPFDPVQSFVDDWSGRGLGAELAMAATASIMRAQRVLLDRNGATLRRFGLTFARYEALVLLAFQPGNAVPMTRMSEWLLVHPTSVTNTVDRLEADGLVRRVPHPTDRRALLVELTDAGRTLADEVLRSLAAEEFGVQGLSDSELRTLVGLLRKVRLAAGEFAEDSPAAAGSAR
jgi:DNA-binding MarR family transcriptional regulator